MGAGMMKPILFNTDMVRAILDGRKTVTRRVVKLPKSIERDLDFREEGSIWWQSDGDGYGDGGRFADLGKCVKYFDLSPYRPGDILYVRETWCRFDCSCCEGDTVTGRCLKAPDAREGCYMYRSTNEITGDARWRPSIHMPREAARIFLRVTAVRVERVQEIDEDGARAEGLCAGWSSTPKSSKSCSARQAFMWLWNSTIKPANRNRYGWAANPWVWVIEFEHCEKPEEG